MLVQHIAHNHGALVRQPGSASGDAEQYIVKGTSINLSSAFRRYQTAEELGVAIAHYEERLSAPAVARNEPAAVRRNEQQVAKALAMSSLTAPIPKPEPSQRSSVGAARPVEQSRCPVEPTLIEQPAKAAAHAFDIEAFRQRVKRGEVSLALDDKGRVRVECFIHAGVPAQSLPLVAADHRFVAEAGAQIDKAVRQIRNHIEASPDHLRRADRLSLTPEAPAYLRDLWHFHAPSRLFRDRMVAALASLEDVQADRNVKFGALGGATAHAPLKKEQPSQSTGAATIRQDSDAQIAARRAARERFGPTR